MNAASCLTALSSAMSSSSQSLCCSRCHRKYGQWQNKQKYLATSFSFTQVTSCSNISLYNHSYLCGRCCKQIRRTEEISVENLNGIDEKEISLSTSRSSNVLCDITNISHGASSEQVPISVVHSLNGENSKRQSHTLEQQRKKAVAQLAEETDVKIISKLTIRVDYIDGFDGPLRKRQRLSGGGRKPRYPLMEDKLQQLVVERREQKSAVTRKEITKRALLIAAEQQHSGFRASNGWWGGFAARHNISYRAVTTHPSKPHLNIQQLRADFVSRLRQTMEVEGINIAHVYNMDETSICLDMPPTKTWAEKGALSVPVATTGHEKTRLSLMVCTSWDGTTILPAVVIKKSAAKKEPQFKKVKDNLWVCGQENAYNTKIIMQMWASHIFNKFRRAGKCILTMDNCSVHKGVAYGQGVIVCMLPPNTTSVVQPMDNGIIRMIKAHITTCWNAQSPPLPTKPAEKTLLLIEWISEALNILKPELIARCFDKCWSSE
jgi:hypothetical protein